jgi:nucleotide-binding universal stress UspA family protein
MRTIVVAYDGSEHARRALERAADLAKEGASLTVVSVAEGEPTTGARGPATAPVVMLAAERQRALEDAVALLRERGVEAETVEAFGDPGSQIAEEAKRRGADLVVVGTRGRNALERLLLGSVSTKVVHEAACDVLVVR